MIKKIKFEIHENAKKEIEVEKTMYKFIAESMLDKYISELLNQNYEYILLED